MTTAHTRTETGQLLCDACQEQPAGICEHDCWKVGSVEGTAYWYYCQGCFLAKQEVRVWS